MIKITRLVGVLHDEVLAGGLFHASVDDAAQNAPRVVQVQRDVRGEFSRLVLLRSEDRMFRRVAHVKTRHVTEK